MRPGTQVLIDPESDRRLARDGFVKLPLLSAADVAPLRERFLELRGTEGEGFASDLIVDDPEYRETATREIAKAVDEVAGSLFVDHEPFLRSFLCKYPGPTSDLYLHRDWMYVDEREGARTYVVWIALQDITGDNGQLRVLRGSHRLDDTLRGTSLTAPWLDHVDTIERRLLSVPVRAGECIVFDNALVHSSYPNHTDDPRVAVAVGFRPTGVPLVHFRRIDEALAARYDVDEAFFGAVTAQGLIAQPPELPVAEEVPIVEHRWSADELAARLDRGGIARLDRIAGARHRLAEAVAGKAKATATQARARGRSIAAEPARLAERRRRARARRPERPARPPLADRLKAAWHDLPTKAAIGILGANEAVITTFGPATPAVWDPAGFDWSARVEAAYPDIRAEVEALLAGPVEIPHIEDVTGGIPQGNIGPWRSFVLMHQGTWIDFNCAKCPKTTEVVRSIPGLTMAGFSVLEPGTHITEHRGPNKGALRHQLGVIVPGAEGDCRIRVGDEMLVWREGESVMFDFTVPHEAWNDSDGIRVLLMLEVVTPLPWYLDRPNRLAQHAMSWFPTTRDMAARLRALEPTLERA
jgi:beta-hydroxylase